MRHTSAISLDIRCSWQLLRLFAIWLVFEEVENVAIYFLLVRSDKQSQLKNIRAQVAMNAGELASSAVCALKVTPASS